MLKVDSPAVTYANLYQLPSDWHKGMPSDLSHWDCDPIVLIE